MPAFASTAFAVSAVVKVDMVRPGLLGSRNDFGQRYCGGIRDTRYPGGDYV